MQMRSRSTWYLWPIALAATLASPDARADHYTYDAIGRLARVDYTAGGLTRYHYDANGRLTSRFSTAPLPLAVPTLPVPPATLGLLDAWPNPASEGAAVAFALPRAGSARVGLFDVAGREVVRIARGAFTPGRHELGFSAATLPAGLYFVRFEAAGRTFSRRLAIVH